MKKPSRRSALNSVLAVCFFLMASVPLYAESSSPKPSQCLADLAPASILVILQGCAPADEVGIWTGIQNFTRNISRIVAPAATGFLIAITGSYVPGFALGSGVLLIGIFVYG